MRLFISNNKVRFKSDDGIWYEFGLQEIDGQLYRTEYEAVDDPGPGYAEHAVIQFGVNKHKIHMVTREEEPYLRLDPETTEEAITEPFSLAVNGTQYQLVAVQAPDGELYLDYAVLVYPDGLLDGHIGKIYWDREAKAQWIKETELGTLFGWYKQYSAEEE